MQLALKIHLLVMRMDLIFYKMWNWAEKTARQSSPCF